MVGNHCYVINHNSVVVQKYTYSELKRFYGITNSIVINVIINIYRAFTINIITVAINKNILSYGDNILAIDYLLK